MSREDTIRDFRRLAKEISPREWCAAMDLLFSDRLGAVKFSDGSAASGEQNRARLSEDAAEWLCLAWKLVKEAGSAS